MRRCLLAAAVAWWCGPASAAQWTLDKAHSKLGFSGTQVGAAFSGQFRTFDAAIDFDPAAPQAGHVTVTIDLTSARSGDTQRDEALPQPEWFDTAKAAQAQFESTHFVAKGGNAFEAPGTLTLRGVRRSLVLPFTLVVSGDTAHASGHAQIMRTDFGVGQGQWSAGDMVGLQVGLDFEVTATRAH